MCRENIWKVYRQKYLLETSLHVQRKLPKETKTIKVIGNISACAEKTPKRQRKSLNSQKHLCMCRENSSSSAISSREEETSLHVQRKRLDNVISLLDSRNISACAEKTRSVRSTTSTTRKHLCMCRENGLWSLVTRLRSETSLHVQRKQRFELSLLHTHGNISACAEKTSCCAFCL